MRDRDKHKLKTFDDFEDIIEYEAYVLTVLVMNVCDDVEAAIVYPMILDVLDEHEGLDPALATELGTKIRNAQEKETVH